MSITRIESKYLTVTPNIELHYLEKGEGEPILFIPGLTFAGEIFAKQIEHFSKTYRVIAIDPRSQGLSTKTVHGNDYLTHGQDIAVLMQALDLKNVVLVGWSTGNLEVWSYLSQFGEERIKAVVTIDMSPLPLSADPKWWTEGSIEDLSAAATQVLTSPEGARAFFSEYTTSVMFQHEIKPAELEYLLDISAKTPYYICHSLFCNAVFSNFYDAAKEVSETLPSLMFIAEHWADIALPFMKENFPGTETYVMGGHMMFYEYPEKWNSTLEGFLAKLNE
jgi:non-heme chloroperoxidase